ncbi:hypothetical protein [Lentibacillus salinarum]|uniref:Uncharacterized protein n=1 Tax=Lentibacillus salinarum TaxID=446820 RepID=A0ABW3ZSW5_9BACI
MKRILFFALLGKEAFLWRVAPTVIINGKPRNFGYSDFQRKGRTAPIAGVNNTFPLIPKGYLH